MVMLGPRLIGGAVALLALLTPGASAPAATLPGENGKIAFARGAGPTAAGCDDDIYSINPDGTGETQLTSGPDCDGGAAWRPNGKLVAFARGTGLQRESRRMVGPSQCVPGPHFTADVWTMNENGSGQTGPLPFSDGKLAWPDWGPDGRGYLARRASDPPEGQNPCTDHFIVAVGYPPGQPWPGVFGGVSGDDPSFSPIGNAYVYSKAESCCFAGDLAIRGLGGSPQFVDLTSGTAWDYGPAWSPDGSKIAFSRAEQTGPDSYAPADMYVINADGTGLAQLTSDPGDEDFPAWSPDGTKLAFSKCCFGSATTEIFTMNADGSDPLRLTFNDVNDSDPAWQRPQEPLTSYARPKGATPLRLSLVPAYRQCTAANREHGPPLAFPSCAPPDQTSDLLTVGTADSNGKPTKSVGSLEFRTVAGNPGTPADEADVALEVSITDVRRQTDLSDYDSSGFPNTLSWLQIRFDIRMTDRSQEVAPAGAALTHTTEDFEFPYPVTLACVATPDPDTGGSCTVATTLEAYLPGSVREGQRTTWQLDNVRVDDGGPDDDLETPADNTVFAVPGVFVP